MDIFKESVRKLIGWCPNAKKANENRKQTPLENFGIYISGSARGDNINLKNKSKKAIKAGLIGAILMIIINLITGLIVYWSMAKPTVQELFNQYANSTSPMPTNFSSMPPDLIILGLAVLFGFLLTHVVYLLAGIIVAYYIAPYVRCTSLGNVIVQNAIYGAIAGAVTQAISTPFDILFMLVMRFLYPAYIIHDDTKTDILQWLSSQLTLQYSEMLATAAIFGAAAALACGIAAKGFCRNNLSI
jgi:hypothetical protein